MSLEMALPASRRLIQDKLFWRRSALRLALFAMLLTTGASLFWLGALRSPPLDERTAVEFTVTSPGDTGPGSLREALFAAARAVERPRILLELPRVEIATQLPPVTHPRGIVIEAPHGTVIDARSAGHDPLLEIRAAHSVLRNLTVHGAAGTAIAVHAEDVLLEHVTVEDSAIGVDVIAKPARILMRHVHMLHNRIGVQLEEGATEGSILASDFEDQLECAVWAVWPAVDPLPVAGTFRIADGTFRAGRDGVIVANAPLAIEHNDFLGNTNTAVSLFGGNVIVRANRIREVRQAAILADSTARSLIAANEIHHNPGIAVSIRSAAGTRVEGNRLYTNGYGIVTVYGRSEAPVSIIGNLISGNKLDGVTLIGASPILRANRVLANGGVGIKLLDIVPAHGARIAASPLLEANVVAGNTSDRIARGDYAL